jgi:hypothetical protein
VAEDAKRRPIAIPSVAPLVVATQPTAAEKFVTDFQRLRVAHSDLLAKYLAVLAEGATWTAWRYPGGLPSSGTLSRLMLNRLVEAHVKKRLRIVARAYLQIGEGLRTELDDECRAWFEEARRACTNLAESLTSLKRPGIVALVSPAIALGGLIAKAPVSLHSVGSAVLRVAAASSFFAFLLVLAFRDSHREKRRLFLWGDFTDTAAGEEPKRNIYRSEDRLFALIRRRKPRELSLDTVLWWVGLTFLMTVAVAAVFVTASWWAWVLGVVGFAAAAVMLGLGVRRLQRRPYHEWR